MVKNIMGGVVDAISGVFTGNFDLAKQGLMNLGKGLLATSGVGFAAQFGQNIAGAFRQGYQDGIADFNTGPDLPNIPGMPEFQMPNLPGLDQPGLQPFMPAGSDSVQNVAEKLGAGKKETESEDLRKGLYEITGGGKQTTNIYIQHPKFAEQVTFDARKTQEMNERDMERYFKEWYATMLNDLMRTQY
jgi:hypothetical protein